MKRIEFTLFCNIKKGVNHGHWPIFISIVLSFLSFCVFVAKKAISNWVYDNKSQIHIGFQAILSNEISSFRKELSRYYTFDSSSNILKDFPISHKGKTRKAISPFEIQINVKYGVIFLSKNLILVYRKISFSLQWVSQPLRTIAKSKWNETKSNAMKKIRKKIYIWTICR